MWGLVIAMVMMSLTGLYMNINKQQAANVEQARMERMADNMAVYREAVARYFGSHPAEYGRVGNQVLRAGNALPEWYVPPSAANAWDWVNYRDTNGLIYIYASSALPFEITADIVRLSRNSVLAGSYRSGDATLYSPRYGSTNVPMPEIAMADIPHGSPVWVTHAK